MKSVAELEEIRQKTKAAISFREDGQRMRIVIGMATCGIAAGARPVMNAFINELHKRKIQDVAVVMTGCIGVCKLEPIVEVIWDGGKATYVNMTPEKVARVVAEHVVNGRVCIDYTLGATAGSVGLAGGGE